MIFPVAVDASERRIHCWADFLRAFGVTTRVPWVSKVLVVPKNRAREDSAASFAPCIEETVIKEANMAI